MSQSLSKRQVKFSTRQFSLQSSATSLEVPRAAITSDKLAINMEIPHRLPLRTDNLLESTILRITALLQQKNTNGHAIKGERQKTRSGRVPKVKLLSPSEMWYPTGTSVCDKTHSIITQVSSPELWCADFLLRLHQVGRLTETLAIVVELNLQPLFSLKRSG